MQKDIEERLAKRAIEPQVVISLQEQNATDVAVFGDAANSSFKQRITPGGERILDVIAKAGVKEAAYEMYVTLKRGNTRATVYLPRLLERPEENIFVRPGDIIYLYREPQTFLALGAVGNANQTIVQELTGQFKFDNEHLSLAEGVAKAGGLLDTRANAGQVFLYRLEYREVLERLGLNLTMFPPEQKFIPTVYRANYRDPSMFFAAGQFPDAQQGHYLCCQCRRRRGRQVSSLRKIDYVNGGGRCDRCPCHTKRHPRGGSSVVVTAP